MLRRVNANVLFVHDLEGCLKFYRDVLRLEVVFSDDVSHAFKMEGQDFLLLKVEAAVEMLNEAVVGLQPPASHRVMLCVDVDDVDAVYEKFKAWGLTFLKPPVDQPWGWRTAYFTDPEGIIWELRQAIPAK